jgi:hypothetical protein
MDAAGCQKRFGFPYPPYDIQQEFMTRLFDVCERKRVGIFESPTGTVCGLPPWSSVSNWLVIAARVRGVAVRCRAKR